LAAAAKCTFFQQLIGYEAEENRMSKITARLACVALLTVAFPSLIRAEMVATPPSALQNPEMGPAAAQDALPVMVGGAAMYPSKNIIQNATNSKDHSILVSAIKEAALVALLEGKGPFTVFAPTNEAFEKLPKGTIENLMQPENKAALVSLLSYHVVPGNYNAMALLDMVHSAGGAAKLKTLAGPELTVKDVGGKPQIIDAKGDVATITTPDIVQSNGIIQVIDRIMAPGA
jgi:uncharacterized surface protein with fasciclin (FAS1) repeats